MTEKLDNFKKDILSFLEKREPERVLWREITEGLFPSYKFSYKSEKVFGVALSQKLKFLKEKGLILKEGDLYGTPKSKSSTEKKPSTEKPSEIDLIRNDLVEGTDDLINRSWNRCVLFADQTNLKPHPMELFNERIKAYNRNLVEFDPNISLRVRRDIIREFLFLHRKSLPSN